MTDITKRLFASLTKDNVTGLAPGQFTLRLTGPGENVDYSGDVTVPGGVVSRSGKIPMFRDHNPSNLIGSVDWRLTGYGDTAALLGTATIPPGLTEIGDETYRLVCAGVLTDVSIGFDPIEKERIPTGYRYTKWRLLECSCVSIGCLPTAVILQKSLATRETPTMPTTRAERLARVAELTRGDGAHFRDPIVANPTAYLNHHGRKDRASQVRAEGEHGYAVARLQRSANPEITDRLVTVERLTSPLRQHGLAEAVEERETEERLARKNAAPLAPAWTRSMG